MILTGFQIQNWGCIQKVEVPTLGAGINVLHAPNGSGKSSIVAALRACLMDYKHNSTHEDLKRYLPAHDEKLAREVRVQFLVGKTEYNLLKTFKTNGPCELESRAVGGSWRKVSSNPSEVHDQALALLGGKASDAGLYQLLWLPQTQYELPEAKKFDTDLQSRLRGILGVMQTPQDDAFARQIQAKFTETFRKNHVAGTVPAQPEKRFLPTSSVMKAIEQARDVKEARDSLLGDHQRMLELQTAQGQKTGELARLKQKLATWQAKVEELSTQVKLLAPRRTAHADAVRQLQAVQQQLQAAQAQLKEATQARSTAKRKQEEAKLAADSLAEKQEELQAAKALPVKFKQRAEELRLELQALQAYEKSQAVQKQLKLQHQRRATLEKEIQAFEESQAEIKAVQQINSEALAAPTDKQVEQFQDAQRDIDKFQAKLDSASLVLEIKPVSTMVVKLDQELDRNVNLSNSFKVRQQATITLADGGTVSLRRGDDNTTIDEDASSLAQARESLQKLQQKFQVNSFIGMIELQTGAKARKDKLKKLEDDFNKKFKVGGDELRAELQQITLEITGDAATPTPVAKPARSADAVEADVQQNARELKKSEQALESLEKTEREAERAAVKLAAEANQSIANAAAFAAENELRAAIDHATREVVTAETACSQQQLTPAEEALETELQDATVTRTKAEDEFKDAKERVDNLNGQMRSYEGLHQKLSDAEARYHQAMKIEARELLQANALEKLRQLFDANKEQQTATVRQPLEQRIRSWLRMISLPDNLTLNLNENFLPEKLQFKAEREVALKLEQESTGTQEQLSLMVRLALGGLLSSVEEPQAMLLDDALTHTDATRFEGMHKVLKKAAEGNALAVPPAGPLQILLFTCHPDRYAGLNGLQQNLADLIVRFPLPRG
jgi:DNA repair exonuclease SbcCD ATPase subunit